MSPVPWTQEINFGSALLLHSCITVFLKEISNCLAILYHVVFRHKDKAGIKTPVVLDGYTSVFSQDHDGELAELYFTNTGFILLIVSLACAIAMNLHLPATALNILIATAFGLTFIASALVACRERSFVMPIMALRRAGRFIWSDTPFVNFFTLIYVAVVLRGSSSKIVLRDYMVFRSIAILELVFMKAKIAAAPVNVQQTMLSRLLDSEFVVTRGVSVRILSLLTTCENISHANRKPSQLRSPRRRCSTVTALSPSLARSVSPLCSTKPPSVTLMAHFAGLLAPSLSRFRRMRGFSSTRLRSVAGASTASHPLSSSSRIVSK
jgi:hypothetical protein